MVSCAASGGSRGGRPKTIEQLRHLDATRAGSLRDLLLGPECIFFANVDILFSLEPLTSYGYYYSWNLNLERGVCFLELELPGCCARGKLVIASAGYYSVTFHSSRCPSFGFGTPQCERAGNCLLVLCNELMWCLFSWTWTVRAGRQLTSFLCKVFVFLNLYFLC